MFKQIIDYLVNNLGINAGVAASLVLTLMTFSFGFIINWIAAAFSRWRKERNYKRSLKIILLNFYTSCEKQYNALEDFPLEKGFLDGNNYVIPIASNFSLQYLTSLDINVFIENFSSLFNKNRAGEISEILESIEKVRATKDLLNEQTAFFYSNYTTHLSVYNDNLDRLRSLQDDLITKIHQGQLEPKFHDFLVHLNEVFKSWDLKGAQTYINHTLSELVNPLFSLSTSITPNYISKEIIDYCLKCRLSVVNITNVEQLLKETIIEYKTVHKDAFELGFRILEKW